MKKNKKIFNMIMSIVVVVTIIATIGALITSTIYGFARTSETLNIAAKFSGTGLVGIYILFYNSL